MKTDITIPVPKVEDVVALDKRRESYAAARDLQASEFNEAIIKRLQSEAKNVIKCDKCGKEFASGKVADAPQSCPECKGKPEILPAL
jgi:rubrerythrin